MSLLKLHRDVFLRIVQYLKSTSLRKYIGLCEETFQYSKHLHFILYRLKRDQLPIRRSIIIKIVGDKDIVRNRIIKFVPMSYGILLKGTVLNSVFEMKLKNNSPGSLGIIIKDSNSRKDSFELSILNNGLFVYYAYSDPHIHRRTLSMDTKNQNNQNKANFSKDDVITFILNMLPFKDFAYYYVGGVPSKNIINKIPHTQKRIEIDGTVYSTTVISLRALKVSPILPYERYIFWNYDGKNFDENLRKIGVIKKY
jgi:hypothetical protein